MKIDNGKQHNTFKYTGDSPEDQICLDMCRIKSNVYSYYSFRNFYFPGS